jgi:hypothetical protein
VKLLFNLTILAIIFVTTLCAQHTTSVDSTLRAIELLYNNARYVDAELESRRLSEAPLLTDSAKVEIEKWIAFSLIAQGKPSFARERFVQLLTINPDFDLDPVLTSPKILTVFNDAKANYLSRKRVQQDTVKSVHRSFRGMTYRTAIFPGWEQLYQGRTTSGSIFLGAGLAALGAGVTFEILRAKAREEYLNARTPSVIASKYNSYNSYRKAELYSFIGFAVVYFASEIDVFTISETSPVAIHPSGNDYPGQLLTLSVRF